MTLTQNYKFAKFGPKTEMSFHFYEIWYSQHFSFSFNNNLQLILSKDQGMLKP